MSVFPGEIVNICRLGKSKCRRLDFGLCKAFVGEASPGLTIGADFYEGQFEEGIEEGVFEDGEIKDGLANAAPYGDWLHAGIVKLSELPSREHIVYPHSSVVRRQRAFGYTEEDLRILVTSRPLRLNP